MNKIEFVLSKYRGIGDNNRDYLVVEIKIDGNLLIDFQKYATDISSLISCSEYSLVWRVCGENILTSWTGIPKDVGIYKPFKGKSEAGRIIWEIGDPKPLKKKVFEFDQEEFAAALEKLYVQGDELIEELIVENLDRETARDIEIVPDDNTRYFINPARYFDPLSALPYSKLPKRLRKYKERYMSSSMFEEAVVDSAEAIGGRVSDFGEPGVTPNFFSARVDMRDSHFYVLCSERADWAFAAVDPAMTMGQIRFIDIPEMANAMARMFGITPLTTAELSAPFVKKIWMTNSDEKYWNTQTMGDALFNWWD